jgi:alpha-tubulin suppressor-like RCC1 family protein
MGNGTNGNTNHTPVSVSGSGFLSINGGEHQLCATKIGGVPRCWGENAYGQVGNNSQVDQNIPQVVSGVGTAIHVGGGFNQSCLIHADGTAECWGRGLHGVLGDNNTSEHNALVPDFVLYFP